jgi:ABC-2 type transport system ATP-binding protein
MLTTLLKPARRHGHGFGAAAASQPMRVRRLIGYVPQLLSADALFTGHENVELFARLFEIPRRERREREDAALSAMGLTEAASRLVKTCSTSPRSASTQRPGPMSGISSWACGGTST